MPRFVNPLGLCHVELYMCFVSNALAWQLCRQTTFAANQWAGQHIFWFSCPEFPFAWGSISGFSLVFSLYIRMAPLHRLLPYRHIPLTCNTLKQRSILISSKTCQDWVRTNLLSVIKIVVSRTLPHFLIGLWEQGMYELSGQFPCQAGSKTTYVVLPTRI